MLSDASACLLFDRDSFLSKEGNKSNLEAEMRRKGKKKKGGIQLHLYTSSFPSSTGWAISISEN